LLYLSLSTINAISIFRFRASLTVGSTQRCEPGYSSIPRDVISRLSSLIRHCWSVTVCTSLCFYAFPYRSVLLFLSLPLSTCC